MADKAEFLQAIDDAILDADSLERFINGDDTQDVLTRLSKRYPTLQKALKELFENGGIAGRFKTLAELQASPLVDGDYALVADDAGENNGIYIKEGDSWVKSKYDPASDLIKLFDLNNKSDVFKIIDANGQTVIKTTADGRHYFVGLGNDLKTELNAKASYQDGSSDIFTVYDTSGQATLKQDSKGDLHLPSIGNLTTALDEKATFDTGDSLHLLNLVDAEGTVYLRINDKAELLLSGVGSVNEHIKQANTVKDKVLTLRDTTPYYLMGEYQDKQLIKDSDITANKVQEILNPAQIDALNLVWYSVRVLRIPSLIRIGVNKYLVPFEVRASWADVGNISVATCIYTIDPETKEGTVSDINLVHESHDDPEFEGQLVTYMNPSAVILDDDQTIIMNYVARHEKIKHELLMVKSIDGGKTWQAPVDVSDMLHRPLGWNLIASSSGGIVKKHGKNKGRIVFPAFAFLGDWQNSNMATGFIYSDDEGDTWHVGKFYDELRFASENQVVEDYNGNLIFNIRVEYKEFAHAIAIYDEVLDEYINVPVVDSLNREPAQGGFAQGENKYDNSNAKILLSTNRYGLRDEESTGRKRRSGLRIGVSYDVANSWYVYDVSELDTSHTGYTNISMLDSENVLVVYEGDNTTIKSVIIPLVNILKGEKVWA